MTGKGGMADHPVARHGSGGGDCPCHCAGQADSELLARLHGVDQGTSNARAFIRSRRSVVVASCAALHAELSSTSRTFKRLEKAHASLTEGYSKLRARLEAARSERDEAKTRCARVQEHNETLQITMTVMASKVRELTVEMETALEERKAATDVSKRAQAELQMARSDNELLVASKAQADTKLAQVTARLGRVRTERSALKEALSGGRWITTAPDPNTASSQSKDMHEAAVPSSTGCALSPLASRADTVTSDVPALPPVVGAQGSEAAGDASTRVAGDWYPGAISSDPKVSKPKSNDITRAKKTRPRLRTRGSTRTARSESTGPETPLKRRRVESSDANAGGGSDAAVKQRPALASSSALIEAPGRSEARRSRTKLRAADGQTRRLKMIADAESSSDTPSDLSDTGTAASEGEWERMAADGAWDDESSLDTNNTAATLWPVPCITQRTRVALGSSAMKQHQRRESSTFDVEPALGMARVDRCRAVDLLCETLDNEALWDVMHEHRVKFSHTFEFSVLAPDAKRWVRRLLRYQHEHRRALWERQHWVSMWRGATASAAMNKEVSRRSRRQTSAVKVWREIHLEGTRLVEAGLLSADVWREPFLWWFCRKPLRLPDDCLTLQSITEADAAEPERTFHVDSLASHRFFRLTRNTKYPQAFLLPSAIYELN